MTREEAIKILNQYDVNFYWADGEPIPADKQMDAFEMAIRSLEAWGKMRDDMKRRGQYLNVLDCERIFNKYMLEVEGAI